MDRRPWLELGSQGEAVERLQELLHERGRSFQEVTGVFDEPTDWNVRLVQDEADITVDGIVGDDTWAVLLGNPLPVDYFDIGITGTDEGLATFVIRNYDRRIAKNAAWISWEVTFEDGQSHNGGDYLWEPLSPGEEFEDAFDLTGTLYGKRLGGPGDMGDGDYTIQLWLSTEHRSRGMTATTGPVRFRWVTGSHPVLLG